VTMSLSAVVWLQFATQIFGAELSTPVWWGRGKLAVEALNRALIMSIATIMLIQLAVMRHANLVEG